MFNICISLVIFSSTWPEKPFFLADKVYRIPNSSVDTKLLFLKDDTLLVASLTSKGDTNLYRLRKGENLEFFKKIDDHINQLAYGAETDSCFFSTNSGLIFKINKSNDFQIEEIVNCKQRISRIWISQNESRIIAAGTDGRIFDIDVRLKRIKKTYHSNQKYAILSIDVDTKHEIMYFGTADAMIYKYDFNKNKSTQEYGIHTGKVNKIILHDSAAKMLSLSGHGSIIDTELGNNKDKKVYDLPMEPVIDAKLINNILVVAWEGGFMTMHNLADGKMDFVNKKELYLSIFSFACSNDLKILAIANKFNELKIYKKK